MNSRAFYFKASPRVSCQHESIPSTHNHIINLHCYHIEQGGDGKRPLNSKNAIQLTTTKGILQKTDINILEKKLLVNANINDTEKISKSIGKTRNDQTDGPKPAQYPLPAISFL